MNLIIYGLYGFGFLFVVAAVIFLIVRRINEKKNENFEKRDY